MVYRLFHTILQRTLSIAGPISTHACVVMPINSIAPCFRRLLPHAMQHDETPCRPSRDYFRKGGIRIYADHMTHALARTSTCFPLSMRFHARRTLRHHYALCRECAPSCSQSHPDLRSSCLHHANMPSPWVPIMSPSRSTSLRIRFRSAVSLTSTGSS